MTPGGGALPTGVQWRLTYPLASIGSVTLAAGPAATAAGKTLTCVNNSGWVDCMVYGVNSNAIGGGVLAQATVAVLPGIASGSASMGIVNPAATNGTASVLMASATGGLISIIAPPPPPPSTWGISGNIIGGSGAAVTLSGAVAKAATADASGNYAFTGLLNGNYTVAVSKSGYTISPMSKAVAVNGANVTGQNFTASAVVSTWSIFGTVTSGAGATVTLSGAASKTTTADAAGNYSFAGLANGGYTVSAAKAGFSITPASQAVTVSGTNVAGVLFSATAVRTSWIISGTLAPGSGATVTLGGAASRTATADANGKYSFTGLVNGSYTVAPWKTSMSFSPAARAVTLSGADQIADFAGTQQSGSAPVPDVTIWSDRSKSSTSLASPAFSTRQGSELLLAFIGTNSAAGVETVRGVTGGGLTWTLVKRTNTQGGTAEIWRAFATQPLSQAAVTATLSASLRATITVMSFAGVDTSGTNGSGAIGAVAGANSVSEAPGVSLVPTRSQSLIVGITNDTTWAVARTPVAGQSMVHEFVDFWEGTYSVQRINAPVASAGAAIMLSDSYPRWTAFNFSAVEIRGTVPAALDQISATPRGAGQPANPAATNSGLSGRRSEQAVLTNPVTGVAGEACSPGGWAALAGTGFTSQAPQSAPSIPLPFTLGGVRVKVNGMPAPLLMTSAEQVNFQCPQAAPGTPLQLEVTLESGETWQLADSVMNAAAPAIFTIEGSGRALVQIAATSQLVTDAVSSGRPARVGEHVRIYASGLGEAEVELAAGMPAPVDKPIALKNRATVVWNGQEVTPLFAGLVPGTVGVFQIDLEVPRGAAGPEVPLFLRIDLADGRSRLSQQTVVPVGAEPALSAQLTR